STLSLPDALPICCLIANDLNLHPIRQANLPPQPRCPNRLVRGIAPGGIWQQKVLFRVNIIQKRLFTTIQVDPANGHGNHFGVAGLERASSFLKRFVLSCPYYEAGTELAPRNDEWISHKLIVTARTD